MSCCRSKTKSHSQTSYADSAWCGKATIEENVALARDTYRIRIGAAEIARRIVPGQFLMLRLGEGNDPLLARPLALYDTVLDSQGLPVAVDIVYLALGKMTRQLTTRRPGDSIPIWGPLGNGFPVTPTEHLVMVAGGIGQTPFMALAREYLGQRSFGRPARTSPRAEKISLCYGVRTADYLAGVDDFRRLGVDVHLSTEDGSAGHHGLVTELLCAVIKNSKRPCRVVCCGPERMMQATATLAHELQVPCQVSLETPMACGIGVCFSCVAKIRDASGQWDYRRTCVEGPVFDAEDVEF